MFCYYPIGLRAVFKLRRVAARPRASPLGGVRAFAVPPSLVAIARGIHLFPFRTEPLSPSAPMVLGGKPPGRVGRRQSCLRAARATGRLFLCAVSRLEGVPPGPPG